MTINDVDVSGCRFLDEYKHCDICKELCEGHCLVVEDIECKTYEDCYYKQLQRTKQELQKFQDMAKKGLEEFKDVGGCWGCGLQLQLNQDIEDIKQLKAENERLKHQLAEIGKSWGEIQRMRYIIKSISQPVLLPDVPIEVTNKYNQTLQEIKAIAEENQFYFEEGTIVSCKTIKQLATNFEKILDLITKAESEEE